MNIPLIKNAAVSAISASSADTIVVAHTVRGRDDRSHSSARLPSAPLAAFEATQDGQHSTKNGVMIEPADKSDVALSDADWEALCRNAFGLSTSTSTGSTTHPAKAIDHSSDPGRNGSKSMHADVEPRRSRSGQLDPNSSSIACVEADVEAALANCHLSEGAELAALLDSDAKWTNEDFAKFFGEAAVESARSQVVAPAKPTAFPIIRVTSGLRASPEAIPAVQATEAAIEEAKVEPRGRGQSRKTRVVRALRSFVEGDLRYHGAKEMVAEASRRYDETLTTSARNQHKVDAAQKAFAESIALETDFHLSHLASVADRIERCGTCGGLACGSYWCTHCRNRYAARLIEDTRPQLEQRYGTDYEKARPNLLHATILNEIVLPDPELDREHLADFAASIVRRDHREMLGYLRRWQKDCVTAMSAVLSKRGLSLELAEDWIGPGGRDRRFYHPDNVTADADRLIGWNSVFIEAQNHFKSQRKRPDLESATLVTCREDARYEAYLWQLRKASRLNREDIIMLAQGFQCIYREFGGITKTNYPERLKFKSSIEKVIKRERRKLYRISKDDQLPGVAITGMFEMELVDLRHAIGGDHRHSVKAKTLRVLATQERKPAKKRKPDEKISPETERRRMKQGARMRLLDEARARISADEALPEVDFPGLQYAVLLHMHVLIDLNGTPRGDVERWLTGKGASIRGFSGQWPLPYQVMVKGLYENKSVDDSIRDISFYAVKAPLTFNYENTAPKRDDRLPEGDPKHFSDKALAILAWLQQGIGHESLRIAVNWPGADQEKRGPKPKPTPVPKMTEDELEEALAARGSSLPRDPIGQTEIGYLFVEAGEGAEASGYVEASTLGAIDPDALGPSNEDPSGRSSSDPDDRGDDRG